ncbi:MAG TPA: hypothetical protein VH083_27805, partial [Myxococcales bacterium]|nr:hypothetical protein [Myxococcales bacterium]
MKAKKPAKSSKKPAPKKPAAAKKSAPSETARLKARIAKALQIPLAQVELRALRELAATLPEEAAAKKPAAPAASS